MVSFDMNFQNHNEISYMNSIVNNNNNNINNMSIKDFAPINNKIFSYEDRIVRNENLNTTNLNSYNNKSSSQITTPVDDKNNNDEGEYNSSFTSFLPKLTSLVPPSINSPLFGETLPQIPTIHPETHKTLHYLLKNCGVQKVADVPCTYLAQTCEEANVLAEILKQFKEIRVLGFDTETTVFRNHMKGAVSLIQLAPTEDICLLFQVYRMCAFPAPGTTKYTKNDDTNINNIGGENTHSFEYPNGNHENNLTFYDEDYSKYNHFFNSASTSSPRDHSYNDEDKELDERIWDIKQFPYHLKDILTKKSIVKVGVNSIGDAELLKKWYQFEMKGVVDLQLLAHAMKLPVESLSSLSYIYTGQLLEKDGGIKKMKFDKRIMKLEDIIYSARDAVMGLAIFNRMVRPPVTFPDKLPVQRKKNNRKKNRKMKLTDSLYQNNWNRIKKFSGSSQGTYTSSNSLPTPINTTSNTISISITQKGSKSMNSPNIKSPLSEIKNPAQESSPNKSLEIINNNNRRIQRIKNPLSAKYSLKIKTNKNKTIEELNYNHFLKQKLKQLVTGNQKPSLVSLNKKDSVDHATYSVASDNNNNNTVGNNMIPSTFTTSNMMNEFVFNEDYVDFKEEMKKNLSTGVKISAIISPKKKIVNDLAEHLKKVYPANSVVNSEKIVSIMKNSFGYNTHLMVEQRKKRYIYEMVRRLIDSGKFIVNFDNDVVVKSLSKKKKNRNSKKSSQEETSTINNNNNSNNNSNNNNINHNNNDDNINEKKEINYEIFVKNDHRIDKEDGTVISKENSIKEPENRSQTEKSDIENNNGEIDKNEYTKDEMNIEKDNSIMKDNDDDDKSNNNENDELISQKDNHEKSTSTINKENNEMEMEIVIEKDGEKIDNQDDKSEFEDGELTDNEEDKKAFEIQQQEEEKRKQEEEEEAEKERKKRMEFQNKLMNLIEVSISEDNNNNESSHVPLRLIALTIPDQNKENTQVKSLSEFGETLSEFHEEVGQNPLLNNNKLMYDEPENQENINDINYDSDNLSYYTDNSANDYENDYFEEDVVVENYYDNYYSDLDNMTSDNLSMYSYMESPNNSYSSDSDSEGEYLLPLLNKPLHINQISTSNNGSSTDLKNLKSNRNGPDIFESIMKKVNRKNRKHHYISSSLIKRNDVDDEFFGIGPEDHKSYNNSITSYDVAENHPDPGLMDPKSPTSSLPNEHSPQLSTMTINNNNAALKMSSNNKSDVDASSSIISKILNKKSKKSIRYYEDLYEKDFKLSYHAFNDDFNNKNNGYRSDSVLAHSTENKPYNNASSPLALNAFSQADLIEPTTKQKDDNKNEKDTAAAVNTTTTSTTSQNNLSTTNSTKKSRKRKNSSVKQHKLVKRVKSQSLSIYDSL